MCGIIGCVREQGDVQEQILAGLRRLEYRGYDSAGIAVSVNGHGIQIRKKIGRLDNLEKALQEENRLPRSRIGIGHTRWATHGFPSDKNAHPHRGCDDRLVVIHNGILENYLPLKQELQAKGHQFSSDTDSEVFAHLIEELLKHPAQAHGAGFSPFTQAVAAAIERSQGSFGLVVMHQEYPDRLIAARRESPIVLGLSADAGYVASDTPAFLPLTQRVIFLHDDEIAEVKANEVQIFSVPSGKQITRQETLIDWSPEQAEKGGYKHFMLKEIHEQSDVLARTAFDRLVDEQGDIRFENFAWSDDQLKKFQRLHLLACGTALHACLVGKFWLENLAKLPVEVDFASEYRYRNPIVDDNVLAIAVSQSGETADTLGAIREAKRRSAATMAICNVIGSSITRLVEQTVLTHAGPEIGVASTKAFIAQLVALLLFAVRLGRARGTLSRSAGQQIIHDLRQMRSKLDRLLKPSAIELVQQAAQKFQNAKGFLFLGRGVNYPIALEGALKLKEISYLHAEGYPAGEMKHGPIALIEPQLPVLVLAPKGPVFEKTLSNIHEVRARGGQLIVLTNAVDHGQFESQDFIIPLPEMPEQLSPIASVIPLQLFAYFVANLKGCDIDKPRNLAKSVTVE